MDFLAGHRQQPFFITVINAGGIAVMFDPTNDARLFLR